MKRTFNVCLSTLLLGLPVATDLSAQSAPYRIDSSAQWQEWSFPAGTLAVNLTGALLLGFVAGLALSPHLALVAGTAFVGAYTTFSTWMLETHRLAEERQLAPAVANIVVSIALGLPAAYAGQTIAGLL